jgi:hypothetical protein
VNYLLHLLYHVIWFQATDGDADQQAGVSAPAKVHQSQEQAKDRSARHKDIHHEHFQHDRLRPAQACYLGRAGGNMQLLFMVLLYCSRTAHTIISLQALGPKQLTYLYTFTLLSQIKELKEGIAAFYDESSSLWEDVWGEHMHHGERSTATLQALYCCLLQISFCIHLVIRQQPQPANRNCSHSSHCQFFCLNSCGLQLSSLRLQKHVGLNPSAGCKHCLSCKHPHQEAAYLAVSSNPSWPFSSCMVPQCRKVYMVCCVQCAGGDHLCCTACACSALHKSNNPQDSDRATAHTRTVMLVTSSLQATTQLALPQRAISRHR